jgi:hypothetical protein
VFGNFTGSTAAPGFTAAPTFSAANLTSFPTFNQSTSGTAAGLSATLVAGSGGTGVANTATLTLGTSNQSWASLGTGIVKNTTTTGAISDAVAADVYGLWSGTCSSSTFLRGDGSFGTNCRMDVFITALPQVAIAGFSGATLKGVTFQ